MTTTAPTASIKPGTIRKFQVLEAVNVLYFALTGLINATQDSATRLACTNLQAQAISTVQTSSLGVPLFACFELAYNAGASLASMDSLRASLAGLATYTNQGAAVQQICLRFALVEECRILSDQNWTSRQDVVTWLGQLNDAFAPVEDYAALQRDNVTYQALVALHAATAQDLASRSRTLPRMINYSYPQTMPALWIAQRLYADGSRADELIKENKLIHPLFAPMTGRALAS
jgi:prophage DNA circulation protein